LVWVSGRIWCGLVPFFHEEVLAFKLKLRVGAARGGLGKELAEQVLGGDWEGIEPIGPRRNNIECGRASRGRCALFFKGGLGWIHGRGRRLPAFFGLRAQWSGECQ